MPINRTFMPQVKKRRKRQKCLPILFFCLLLCMSVSFSSMIKVNNRNEVCKCVDCSDNKCGGLWKGISYQDQADTDLSKMRIHIVISHCQADLSWIPDFINGHDITSIHIVTKCGKPVVGAPSMANIQPLPNVGRCDHSYVNFISMALGSKITDMAANSIVLFLKDDISMLNQHQHGKWNDLGSMIRIASSSNGFACGIIPEKVQLRGTVYDLSVYHDTEYLLTYSREEYTSIKHSYKDDSVPFKSSFKNLKHFYNSISNASVMHLPKVVPVCYGGVFAVSFSNIKKVHRSVWKNAEIALQRGNNIEEGHFMERLWAILLATPLLPHQIGGLSRHAVLLRPERFRGSHRGVLLHPMGGVPGWNPELNEKCAEGEAHYFLENPDVLGAVKRGSFKSGFEHWVVSGKDEGRTYICNSTSPRRE